MDKLAPIGLSSVGTEVRRDNLGLNEIEVFALWLNGPRYRDLSHQQISITPSPTARQNAPRFVATILSPESGKKKRVFWHALTMCS